MRPPPTRISPNSHTRLASPIGGEASNVQIEAETTENRLLLNELCMHSRGAGLKRLGAPGWGGAIFV